MKCILCVMLAGNKPVVRDLLAVALIRQPDLPTGFGLQVAMPLCADHRGKVPIIVEEVHADKPEVYLYDQQTNLFKKEGT